MITVVIVIIIITPKPQTSKSSLIADGSKRVRGGSFQLLVAVAERGQVGLDEAYLDF